MKFKIGDYVSRNSYKNDTIFLIVDIVDDIYYLKGVDIRLFADAPVEDLKICNYVLNDNDIITKLRFKKNLDRGEFFYLPAKILHIDADQDYLNRCLEFYKKMNVFAVGEYMLESSISTNIIRLLKKYKPDIVIMTGHDSIGKNKDYNNMNNYKNSLYFVNAVNKAREYEKSHDKLIIIAGACQSNYEALIKSGANFASSPKRVNIHALDPAIIAVNIALTEKGECIDLIELLNKTKYGKDGIGGLKTNGMMYVGYPR